MNFHSTEVIPTHHNTLVDLANLVHVMDDTLARGRVTKSVGACA